MVYPYRHCRGVKVNTADVCLYLVGETAYSNIFICYNDMGLPKTVQIYVCAQFLMHNFSFFSPL